MSSMRYGGRGELTRSTDTNVLGLITLTQLIVARASFFVASAAVVPVNYRR